MGAPKITIPRIVFDTSVVISALVFPDGSLAWLRHHWNSSVCVPLISPAGAAELQEVLAYRKFKLSKPDQQELLADYLPLCAIVQRTSTCPLQRRDQRDQIFLDLAHSGKAEALVSSDRDLLALSGQTRFLIESPAQYRQRVL